MSLLLWTLNHMKVSFFDFLTCDVQRFTRDVFFSRISLSLCQCNQISQGDSKILSERTLYLLWKRHWGVNLAYMLIQNSEWQKKILQGNLCSTRGGLIPNLTGEITVIQPFPKRISCLYPIHCRYHARIETRTSSLNNLIIRDVAIQSGMLRQ